MKVFIRLIPLVTSVIWLATTSTCTASASLTTELALECLLANIFPDNGLDIPYTGDDQNFGPTFDNAFAVSPPALEDATHSSLQKRANKEFFIAHPLRGNRWRIELQEMISEDKYESSWLAMLYKGSVVLGSGGQGTVTEGTLQQYKKPLKGSLIQAVDKEDLMDPEPTAIKQSSGYKDYNAASYLQYVGSDAIVDIYAFAFREWTEYKPNGRATKAESIVAYEVMGKSAHPIWKKSWSTRMDVLAAVIQAAIDADKKQLYNMDFKPENVMESKKIPGRQKTIDWGLFQRGNSSTVKDGYQGTFGFMAPGEGQNLSLKPSIAGLTSS